MPSQPIVERTRKGIPVLQSTEETPFVTRQDGLLSLSTGTYKNALRPIILSGALRRSGMTLPEILEWGDKAFLDIAQNLGARVVGHEWGLRNGQLVPEEYPPLLHEFPGYEEFALGAVVDVITDSTPLTSEQLEAIVQLSADMPVVDGLRWSDCYFGQFMNGVDSSGERSLWLVDIDLTFRQVNQSGIQN